MIVGLTIGLGFAVILILGLIWLLYEALQEADRLRAQLEDGEVVRRDPVEDAPRSMLKLRQDR